MVLSEDLTTIISSLSNKQKIFSKTSSEVGILLLTSLMMTMTCLASILSVKKARKIGIKVEAKDNREIPLETLMTLALVVDSVICKVCKETSLGEVSETLETLDPSATQAFLHFNQVSLVEVQAQHQSKLKLIFKMVRKLLEQKKQQ